MCIRRYKTRYSTPSKPVPTIELVTSDGKHKKRWKLDDRDQQQGLGFIDPTSKWAVRKLNAEVVVPPLDDNGDNGDVIDSDNDDPYLLY